MTDDRFTHLLSRLLDEELSRDELEELVRISQDHPTRLEEMQTQLEAAELIALSEDDLRDSALFVSALHARISEDPFVSRVRSEMKLRGLSRQRYTFIPWALAATAVMAVLAASILFSRAKTNSTTTLIAEVVESHGAIRWTGEGGRVEDLADVGREIPGGTLETLTASSWAELVFRDGTTVVVSGPSLLTLSDQAQKVLRLRYGSVSADVTPQPTGHPMLVHTPSADLQVLGTRFNVVAQAETTMLTVDEGHVRLARSSDWETVSVPAQHQVVASLGAQEGLVATPRAASASTWRSNLERDVVHGKWVSGLGQLGKELKEAVALGELSKADAIKQYKQSATLDDEGSVWAMPSPFGTLLTLRVSGSSAGRIVAGEETKLRIRGKLYGVTNVELGLIAYSPEGGFAGKYSMSLAPTDQSTDGESFDVSLSIKQFLGESSSFDKSPVGKVIRDLWCVTRSKKSKLEISHLEFVEGR